MSVTGGLRTTWSPALIPSHPSRRWLSRSCVQANWCASWRVSHPAWKGFLFYPGRRQVPAALRAFIDMIRAPKSAQGARPLQNPFLKG
jgi:hypothetical protein